MPKVRVGVIGVGVLGTHHARLYHESENAVLVGVYDEDTDRARHIAGKYATCAFASVVELAAAVDGLSVAVPTDRHFAVVSELLGLDKHVLVEKPLTSNVADGRRLIDLAGNRKLVLQVGHVERYNPVITYLQDKLREPRFIEAHRLAPYPPPRPGLLPRGTEVGVVMDLMIHDIDVILNLVNSKVERLDAVGIPIISRSEDIANVRVTFANGCVANMTASRVSQDRIRKIRIFQADSYLSLDYQNKKGEIVFRVGDAVKRESVPIEDHDALARELDIFVGCVREAQHTGAASMASAESTETALTALTIADEITRLIHAGPAASGATTS